MVQSIHGERSTIVRTPARETTEEPPAHVVVGDGAVARAGHCETGGGGETRTVPAIEGAEEGGKEGYINLY